MSTNTPIPEASVPPLEKLINQRGQALAYRYSPGQKGLPAVIYLHGYASDMMATKAQYLAGFCVGRNQSYLRFDYSGNGASEGAFSEGTIGQWSEDALAIIDGVTAENLILVGSSMGGWIGLACAMKRPERIKGFIGIAAAPDFTDEIWNRRMDEAARNACRRDGSYALPSSLGEPLRLYRGLLEEGQNHLLLDKPIAFSGPMILLQGRQDAEVPWETAYRIAEKVTPAKARVVMVEDGDHRLARDQDLELLGRSVAEMSTKLSA